ncbi:subtilisin-like protease SBT5.6 [Hibiscus syriacus]|uniref:subtilisin-like protease SBT5.6 n=1 Tax=Hibiscus syriacus TaxID=106335 RepID=UPI001923331F|nr:subtilisin-like protease SBT5.6 [Hibiscus syriacus]
MGEAENGEGMYLLDGEGNEFRLGNYPDFHYINTSKRPGRRVKYAAGIGGVARGTASGGAPLARIAVYKACWAIPGKPKSDGNVCVPEDILAAFDAAIGDGVDVLSVSIGLPQQKSFDQDVMAIGSLHALSRNIITVCAAGNSGPNPSTLSNVAPWIITVGASSIDRRFYSPVYLGNGVEIPGYSMSQNTRNVMYPLVYASDAALPGVSTDSAGYCLAGSLDPFKVNGKIVVCFTGSGLNIDKGIEPDIIAPGFQILAAWSLASSPTKLPYDQRHVKYNIFSGTSMACPHVSGVVTLLRAVHPDWSISAIKSALMTTATLTDNSNNTIEDFRTYIAANPFDFGAGNFRPPDIIAPGFRILAAWSLASSPTKLPYDQRHSSTSDWSISAIKSALMTTATLTDNSNNTIEDFRTYSAANPFDFGAGNFRPVLAADPGLVYDASYEDYLLSMCFVVANLYDPVTVSRTVTNACNCQSKYTASCDQPVYGWFMWNDGLHYVRSVFAVFVS